MTQNKYFVDNNGVIFTVYGDGTTNNPHTIKVDNEKVLILAEDGEVLSEYQLWNSLSTLAVELTPIPEIKQGEEMPLDVAVAQIHKDLEDFSDHWHQEHKKKPENWPLTLPSNNKGLYFEQFIAFVN